MSVGWQQILIVLILALLLFGGGGKISQLMGDFAKGIKSFRKGLQDDDRKLEEREVKDVTPPKDAAKSE